MTTSTQVIKVLRRNLVQALRSRRLDDAEDLLEQLKQEDPISLETRGLELEYLIAKKQWREAGVLADQLTVFFPQSARIHFLAGRVYYREKKYSVALCCFNESKNLHDHWRIRRWLGKTHTQLGQFEKAEAFLIEIVSEYAVVSLDLAWLYERMDQPVRALEHVETYLVAYPEDDFATTQQLRLRARALTPQDLSEDVETLLELEEEVPQQMLPVYVQNLLESGQGSLARQFLSEYKDRFDEQTAATLAWICYRLQAYDLAMSLFIEGLPLRTKDVKYLSSLESAARHCNRIDELIDHYETLAVDQKPLYGRIKTLQKRMLT